jgi:hypothetical protein
MNAEASFTCGHPEWKVYVPNVRIFYMVMKTVSTK